jgi:glutamine synthetase
VDYNFENMDSQTNLPVGTLRIPAYLYHNGIAIGSRALLKKGERLFKEHLMQYIIQTGFLEKRHIDEKIADINLNVGTELEFWVKTPTKDAEISRLQTAQSMQENYWQRTKGRVRTALEESLCLLELYGLEPEMGHKEVGGVKASIGKTGDLSYVMEQIEVDWKYSTNPLEAADKELLARIMIKETFRRNGLEVSFQAKPIDNVAGNGEHIHIGVCLKTDNGKVVNLLSPFEKDSYLNIFGYGALMGILNHYDVLSAFVSPSHDALKRLKPDFEAPVSSVCSLGVSPEMPSRNRTVLIGLVSDLENELARRFEFRAANPHTNLYITLPAMLMCMLDGITYAVESEKSEQELLEELSKQPGKFMGYLKESYAFRAEKNIFTDYSDEEREKLFGKPPKTVYEVINALREANGENDYLKKVFNEQFVDSYCDYMLDRWKKELCNRIIPIHIKEIRDNLYHSFTDKENIKGKQVIEKLGDYLLRDKEDKKCLRSRISEAAKNNDYELLSRLYQEFVKTHEELKALCQEYQDNLVY